jgi:hypothetical protein
MANRKVAVARRDRPGFVPMSRMRDNLLDASDPPVAADACELGLRPGAVHRDDVVCVAAEIKIIRPGEYCFAVGSPGQPDDDGVSSFMANHYVLAPIAGIAGDVIPLRLKFQVHSSLGLAWGVYADKESIPLEPSTSMGRWKWAALLAAAAVIVVLVLLAAAALL